MFCDFYFSFTMPTAHLEKYESAGALMAFTIAHRGPLPTFLSNITYQVISGQQACPTLSDVSDSAVRDVIKKVRNRSGFRIFVKSCLKMDILDMHECNEFFCLQSGYFFLSSCPFIYAIRCTLNCTLLESNQLHYCIQYREHTQEFLQTLAS